MINSQTVTVSFTCPFTIMHVKSIKVAIQFYLLNKMGIIKMIQSYLISETTYFILIYNFSYELGIFKHSYQSFIYEDLNNMKIPLIEKVTNAL